MNPAVLALSRGSTRTTPPAGTEVAATGRTIPRARALPRKAGVRISAAPSSSSLVLAPRSKRARPRLGTTAFVLGPAWAALSQRRRRARQRLRRAASALPRKGASAPTDADDRFDDSRHPRRTLASNGLRSPGTRASSERRGLRLGARSSRQAIVRAGVRSRVRSWQRHSEAGAAAGAEAVVARSVPARLDVGESDRAPRADRRDRLVAQALVRPAAAPRRESNRQLDARFPCQAGRPTLPARCASEHEGRGLVLMRRGRALLLHACWGHAERVAASTRKGALAVEVKRRSVRAGCLGSA